MKKHNSVKVLIITVLLFQIIVSMPATAYADVGPKPSVNITITDPPGTECYATLLGSVDGYGPYSAVQGDAGYEDPVDARQTAFNVFCQYEDPDGYKFWGNVFDASGGSFSWGYYPPDDFKILVYDMDEERLYVSSAVSRYAFDSYYTVELEDDLTISVEEDPQLMKFIMGFFVRVIITIIVELLIALIFGYRERREVRLIVITNVVTQVLLNAALAVLDYSSGLLAWVILFPVMEIAVCIIEGIVYAIGLKSHSRKRAILYAIVANAVTAFLGFNIAIYLI